MTADSFFLIPFFVRRASVAKIILEGRVSEVGKQNDSHWLEKGSLCNNQNSFWRSRRERGDVTAEKQTFLLKKEQGKHKFSSYWSCREGLST